ncbi:MAG TPA: CbtA family protein [Candidatus Sulfopaludibacter sp.]|jgi:predicted cobalt transporter CbtA|nr:CbtA family protein [Candidatus Sulfopaludibacter sp.]
MKTIIFIIISLVSGIMAGEILAAINLFVVEPTTDKAIGYELQKDILKGQQINFNQFNSYRIWQKSGTFAAGAFIGMAYGALMGIVYVFARKYLPFSDNDDRKKAITLAVLMYLAFYLVPFSKYPANPPAVGNPQTIGLRDHLYTTYQITSVIIALGMGILFFKFRKVDKISYIIPAMYLALIASMYFVWEPNPDKIEIPMIVVNTFRALTAATMAIFFTSMGVFFGLLWSKFKPHESSKITAI